ncbi:MAG: hypothetical protein ACTS3F_08070 [Phycisphaerales bacterium]
MNQKTMKAGVGLVCLLLAGVILAWQLGIFASGGSGGTGGGGIGDTGPVGDAAIMSEAEQEALEDEGATNAGAHTGKPTRVRRD